MDVDVVRDLQTRRQPRRQRRDDSTKGDDVEPPSQILAMRPVAVEEHVDVPDAEQRPFVLLGRRIWIGEVALLLLGAGSTYLALTYAWAVPTLIVGAPVLAVVVGSLMTWRHHRRKR